MPRAASASALPGQCDKVKTVARKACDTTRHADASKQVPLSLLQACAFGYIPDIFPTLSNSEIRVNDGAVKTPPRQPAPDGGLLGEVSDRRALSRIQ